ncbi:MAG TPA: alpha/beta fold hydrolase [Gaiellaceae bacterium]|nr:alpha/beta fold hydrolase [Gaiellaceae bacterium]
MEGFLERPVGRTWYRVTGERGRAPLLCLHGGPGSTHHYFAPLERLADERQIVLYDQLGCGRSDRPEDVGWRLAVFLDELDALREHLGLERVHLLGTSWGGMLALEHALARGESIASLVLSSTLACAEEWQAEARRLRDAIDGTDEEAMTEFEARHFYRGGVEVEELVRMRAERNLAVYEAMWGPNEWTMTGALAGWDVRPRLRELTMPTLVLRGAHDLSTPAIAKTLLGGLPNAREVVFAESSHTPVLEETERYLRTVRDFLYAVEAR